MRSPRSRIGLKGEIIAAAELGKAGYRILDSNFRTPYGEIDLIAEDGEYLVIVEVRSLSSTIFCRPIDTISPKKIARIMSATQQYLTDKNLHERAIRFDVVEVEHVKGSDPVIRIVKDAFQ